MPRNEDHLLSKSRAVQRDGQIPKSYMTAVESSDCPPGVNEFRDGRNSTAALIRPSPSRQRNQTHSVNVDLSTQGETISKQKGQGIGGVPLQALQKALRLLNEVHPVRNR